MDFSLTPEQIQVRDMVREFAAREVAPYIQEWDAKGEFHPEVLRKMGELGILGLPIPEDMAAPGSTTSPSPWPARSWSTSTPSCASS